MYQLILITHNDNVNDNIFYYDTIVRLHVLIHILVSVYLFDIGSIDIQPKLFRQLI